MSRFSSLPVGTFTSWKSALETPQRHWRRSDVFIVTFEQISSSFGVPVVNFEQVNAGWVIDLKSIGCNQNEN